MIIILYLTMFCEFYLKNWKETQGAIRFGRDQFSGKQKIQWLYKAYLICMI